MRERERVGMKREGDMGGEGGGDRQRERKWYGERETGVRGSERQREARRGWFIGRLNAEP